MGIERLIYYQEAEPELQLRYEEEEEVEEEVEEVVKKRICSNICIYDTFRLAESFFYGDKSFSRNNVNSFRMGWGGAVVFTKTGDHFEIKKITTIGQGGVRFTGDENALKRQHFQQITTQAVDTCTVYYIDAGAECMLAHFNKSAIGEFREHLNTWIEGRQIQTVFCSALKGKYDEDSTLQRIYNEIKESFGTAKYILFDRANFKGNCYLSQMEFGLSCNAAGETVFFGDVCYRMQETWDPAEHPGMGCSCFTYKHKNVDNLQLLREQAKSLFTGSICAVM